MPTDPNAQSSVNFTAHSNAIVAGMLGDQAKIQDALRASAKILRAAAAQINAINNGLDAAGVELPGTRTLEEVIHQVDCDAGDLEADLRDLPTHIYNSAMRQAEREC